MDPSLLRGRAGSASGSKSSAAPPSPADRDEEGGSDHRCAAAASQLGSAQATQSAGGAEAVAKLASGEQHRRVAEAGGADCSAQETAADAAVHAAISPRASSQPGVVRRLQGMVSLPGWRALRSTD